MPAAMPIRKADANTAGTSHHCAHGILSDLDASVLKYGSRIQANISPSTNEKKLYNNDSAKNCWIKLLRCEPTTLRKPTSLARLADLAVERLIKLIHAITKIKPATAPNRQI